MKQITLVCSVHRERGLCNAEELLKILRVLQPEVAFVEWRPSEFDFYYRLGNLEAHAITKYREHRLVQAVPVDRYDMPRTLLAEMREFEDWMIQRSQEFQELMESENDSVHQHGFKHLNSVTFATTIMRMEEIEDETIKGTGDERLIRWLEGLRHFMQGRERAMVRNVYEHCRENVFDTGVFLVGGAHKTGIVKAIGKSAGTAADLVRWNLDYDAQIP
jgi:hypothetical protein